MRTDIINALVEKGVEIPCADGIIISPGCTIGKGTTILPSTIITGNSSIGEGCVLGPSSYIEKSRIGDNVVFNSSNVKIISRRQFVGILSPFHLCHKYHS